MELIVLWSLFGCAAGARPAVETCPREGRALSVGGDVLVERGLERFAIRERGDVNRDGRTDFIVVALEDGAPSCGNYGECELGLLVGSCHGRYIEAIPIDYRVGLAFAETSTRVGGTSWVDVIVRRRAADGQAEEADLIDANAELVELEVWRASSSGYRRAIP